MKECGLMENQQVSHAMCVVNQENLTFTIKIFS